MFNLIILFFIKSYWTKEHLFTFQLPKQCANALGDWLKILSIKRMKENHSELIENQEGHLNSGFLEINCLLW
jgi:hypothetical protein